VIGTIITVIRLTISHKNQTELPKTVGPTNSYRITLQSIVNIMSLD